MHFRSESIIGAILVAFCIVMYWATFQLPTAPYGTMGPALFPRVLLIVMFPMCVALLARGLWRDLREPPHGHRPFSEWFVEYRNVLVSYVLFFIFTLALPYAGYLISGLIFLLFTQIALGPKKWSKVPQYLAVTVGVLAGLYLLFQWFLLVFLPEGEFLKF